MSDENVKTLGLDAFRLATIGFLAVQLWGGALQWDSAEGMGGTSTLIVRRFVYECMR